MTPPERVDEVLWLRQDHANQWAEAVPITRLPGIPNLRSLATSVRDSSSSMKKTGPSRSNGSDVKPGNGTAIISDRNNVGTRRIWVEVRKDYLAWASTTLIESLSPLRKGFASTRSAGIPRMSASKDASSFSFSSENWRLSFVKNQILPNAAEQPWQQISISLTQSN